MDHEFISTQSYSRAPRAGERLSTTYLLFSPWMHLLVLVDNPVMHSPRRLSDLS